MKMIVVVALALVAAVAAAPVESEPAKIIRSDTNLQPDGSYTSDVETENGIKTQVVGELKKVVGEDGKDLFVLVLRGFYSYLDKDDGHVETVNYTADENGYHAEGPSIPVVPAARR